MAANEQQALILWKAKKRRKGWFVGITVESFSSIAGMRCQEVLHLIG